MAPVDIYLMYCAMKAHFGKGKYDFVQYEGKTKVSRNSFYKRKDRYFFARLSKKYDDPKEIQNWLLSNFVKDRKGYIANFSDENYDSWRLKREGFFDMFAVEMYPLVKEFEPLFEVNGSNHPKLLKAKHKVVFENKLRDRRNSFRSVKKHCLINYPIETIFLVLYFKK